MVLEFIELMKGPRSETEETAYEITTEIFTSGGCYRLYLILKRVFPEAVAYKVDYNRVYFDNSFILSHVVTEIKGKFYDIDGEFTLSVGCPYTKIEIMDETDHLIASDFCYSFTRRLGISC